MRLLKFITGLMGSASLIAVLLFTAITLPTFHLGFYAREYDKHAIPQSMGMTKSNLLEVTEHLLDYIKGVRDELTAEAPVYGEKREFFNEREQDHMVDVKNLFQIGFLVRRIGLTLFMIAVLSLLFCNIKPAPVLAKAVVIGNILFLTVSGVLVFLISRNFSSAFTRFHEIFFSNDLWILNPETDLLINMVPLPFFIDAAALVALLFLGAMAVITFGCLVYIQNSRKG